MTAHTSQGSRHWFDLILAEQFPSLSGNRSLLAHLYALSFHGLSEHENKGCIANLPLILSVLIETEMSSFSIFSRLVFSRFFDIRGNLGNVFYRSLIEEIQLF